MVSRVYDDPNHECYGPVRRCWVILSGLWENLDTVDQHFRWEHGEDWDAMLVRLIEKNRYTERQALRVVVNATFVAVCSL